MHRRNTFLTIGIIVSLVSVSVGADDGEILLAERGGLQVVSIPQPSPAPGFVSTHIELRALDPDAKLVTWTNVKIEGRVHQTWLEGGLGQPTPNLDQVGAGPTYGEDWRALDSHLLLRNNMMGGCTGGCFQGISETNDGLSLAHRYLNSIRPQPDIELRPRTGFGNIKMQRETDAFWIQDPQTHTMPYAQIVTDYDAINGPGEVHLTFGVLGERVINSGEVGGATFGFDGQEPVLVRFAVPEPNGFWWTWLWGFGWLRQRSGKSISPT